MFEADGQKEGGTLAIQVLADYEVKAAAANAISLSALFQLEV